MNKNQEILYIKRRQQKLLRQKRRKAVWDLRIKRENNAYEAANNLNKTPTKSQSRVKYNTERVNELETPFDAPENFSIINNDELTIAYFNEIIEYVKVSKKISCCFNMKHIKAVTSDAIMYLLAVMYSTHMTDNYREYEVGGHFPEDKELKSAFQKVGFINFLNQGKSTIRRDTNYVTIQSGKEFDQITCKEVCDFVQRKYDLKRNQTTILYGIISELMLNTCQHAYNDNNGFKNEWYIYCEFIDNRIEFIFLDTGLGIPSTVRKNFVEKFENIMGTNEYKLIESAMDGEFRSRTKSKFRGRGLPEVKEQFNKNRIKDLKVISGKGIYDPNNRIADMKNEFSGTLFSWSVDQSCFLEKGEAYVTN